METIASIILGTYVISLVLTNAEGPFGLFYNLRQVKQIDNFGVLNCFMCTALWVALILAICFGRVDLLLIAWGGAVLIDEVVK